MTFVFDWHNSFRGEFEHFGQQRQRQLRRTPEHGYTISSPCEPNGSGELKPERTETRKTDCMRRSHSA